MKEEALHGEDRAEKEDHEDDEEEEEKFYMESGNVDGEGEDNLDPYDDDLSDDD